jgi:hypothetical protein
MRLDELEWNPCGPNWQFATLNLPVGGYVYVFRSGDEYEIWRGRGDWLGLSALTAQAVIYHLLAHSRDEG